MGEKETKRILKTIEYYYSDGEEHKRCPVCGIDPTKLEQEIEKAREEERGKIIDRLRMLNSQWSKDFASKIYTKQDVFNHIENVLSKLKDNK